MRLRDWIFILVIVAAGGTLVGHLFVSDRGALAARIAAPAPTADHLSAIVRAVDDSFTRQWESRGIPPAPPASDLTIARRLSLALVGTIPSLEEIRALQRRDPATRLQWYTDYLLNDPRHHDSFAERLTRAFVGTHIEPPNVFRRDIFADWISAQLASDRPYDEWVREMIAGTGFWTEEPAINYLTATCDFNTYEGPDKVQLAGRTAQAFLGVNLECAECHDHPFDVWTRADFHGIAAFFADTKRTSYGGLRDFPPNPQESQEADAPTFPMRVFAQPELLPESGTNRQRLAAWVTAPENRAFGRTMVNRVWALTFGMPLVGTVSSVPTEGPFPEALECLTDDFINNGFRLRRLLRVITRSRVFAMESIPHEIPSEARIDEYSWSSFPITRLRPDQQCNAVLQAGKLTTYDDRVQPFARSSDAVRHLRFREQFGDLGEKEYADTSASVTQKLLMMNGDLVKWNTESSIVNASARIALLEDNPEKAISIAYLATLTRAPTEEELGHFKARLQSKDFKKRLRAMEDLYWSLLNSTEFAWNH